MTETILIICHVVWVRRASFVKRGVTEKLLWVILMKMADWTLVDSLDTTTPDFPGVCFIPAIVFKTDVNRALFAHQTFIHNNAVILLPAIHHPLQHFYTNFSWNKIWEIYCLFLVFRSNEMLIFCIHYKHCLTAQHRHFVVAFVLASTFEIDWMRPRLW